MTQGPGLPFADRFDEEGDWIARQFLSEADLAGSPEDYAVGHAHLIDSYSLHLYRYRDAALGDWVRRLGQILGDEEELERCRRRDPGSAGLSAAREQMGETS